MIPNCLNCGKKGHCTKSCRYPTNSYGCIIYKRDPEVHMVRYLMIQRKYTPEYIELLRGLYYNMKTMTTTTTTTTTMTTTMTTTAEEQLNLDYLLKLIPMVSEIERNYILIHDFDYLWGKVWQWTGTIEQLRRIHCDHDACQEKFYHLKLGIKTETLGLITFESLFKTFPTQRSEPDWEFPKGKRHEGESDYMCALREFCEETCLKLEDFDLHRHETQFREKFTGINGVEYCNNYYLGSSRTLSTLVYYDPNHIEQNKEIRKIGWFTLSELMRLVNPRYEYRIKMINNVDLLCKTFYM